MDSKYISLGNVPDLGNRSKYVPTFRDGVAGVIAILGAYTVSRVVGRYTVQKKPGRA